MEPECVVYVQLDGRPPLNRITVPLSEQRLKEYLGYLWLIDEIKRRFNDPSPDQVAALLAVIADRSPANSQDAAHLTISEEPDESREDQGKDPEAVVMSAFDCLARDFSRSVSIASISSAV